MNTDYLLDLLRYFAIIVLEGDWANDWLTHLPEHIRPETMELGKYLAAILGT